MLAACLLALAVPQSQDVFLVAGVVGPQGEAATFFGAVIGASKRLSARVGVIWVRRKDGSWRWINPEPKKAAWGAPADMPADLKSWEPMDPDGPSEAELTYAGEDLLTFRIHTPGDRSRLLGYSTIGWGGEAAALSEPGTRAIEEAMSKWKAADAARASEAAQSSWGWEFVEGRLHLRRAFRTSPPALVASAPDPEDRTPATAWPSAQSSVPGAVAAAASESAGWGVVCGPDTVHLAPYSRGRFSGSARSQAWPVGRIVSFQVFVGDEVRAIDQEARRLHAP